MGEFRSLGGYVDKSRFKKRPRYSLVIHDVRERLDISLTTYVVVDSIHKLSSSNPRYPYCIMSKEDPQSSYKSVGARFSVRLTRPRSSN